MSPLDAAYNAVHDYPDGGAPAIARRLGKSPTTLCHELTATGSAKLGLVDAVKISQLTRSTAIAQAFCAQLGGVYLPAVPTEVQGDLAVLGNSIREFGEFASNFSQALTDGLVTHNELRSMERQALEAIGAITEALAVAKRRHEDGKPAALRKVRAA